MTHQSKLRIAPSIVLLCIAIVAILVIVKKGNIQLNRGQIFLLQSAEDTVMIEGRHMGNVNLNKFVDLATKLPGNAFTQNNYVEKDDSVFFTFSKRQARYFYGTDDGKYWLNSYHNIPIRLTETGFVAAVQVIDSVKYIHIPYHILASVAQNVPYNRNPTRIAHASNTSRDSLTTISNKNVLPEANATVGKKIQVEGYVLRNVTDILSRYPEKDQYHQMEALWRFAKNHWNYIHDPDIENDVWRSASETIENYYLVDGRCYSGDCDDFAILMASFARQIGYESHVVTAFKEEGKPGHAYAEFKNPENGKWTSLDWNSNRFGGKPYDGKVYRTYTDI